MNESNIIERAAKLNSLNSIAQLFYDSNSKNKKQKFMDLQNEEVKAFFRSLNANQVEYMLVGGMAGLVHGHIRTTVDLDLWVKETPVNKKKLVSALKSNHVPGAENYLNVDMIPDWSSLMVGEKGFELDLMGYLKNFSESDFDKVYKRCVRTSIDGIPLTVIGKKDLISEKLANSRPKDLEDVRALEALELKKNNGIKVYALNRKEFEDMIVQKNISSENVTHKTKSMFISIIDSGADPILKDSNNYLTLQFDDVEMDISAKAVTMNKNHVKQIHAFIGRNRDKLNCFIHCTAGVSRSGSIGKYIIDELNGDIAFFKKKNPHIDVKSYFLKRLDKGKNKGISMGM